MANYGTIERLSTKLVRMTEGYKGAVPTIQHWCPACKGEHGFAVDQPFRNGARWSWDNNVDKPTFQPSMNIRIGPYPSDIDSNDGKPGQIDVCHYFLHAGRIQYLSDCTHELAGQTVDLPIYLKDGMNKARKTARRERSRRASVAMCSELGRI